MRPSLPREDLDFVLSQTLPFWSEYRSARLFITGGTGLIGGWLLECVQRANEILGSAIHIGLLTRNREHAFVRLPWLSNARNVQLFAGDVATFSVPAGHFDLCIHAAGNAADASRAADATAFDAAVAGTRRVLDLAAASGVSRLLFTSSGAVYGRQPADLLRIPESYLDPSVERAPETDYGRGKRASEELVRSYCGPQNRAGVVARIFAVIGPNIPLDGPFAAGNFIRDALDGVSIKISGDGRPVRSYLYMSDLSIWLFRILMSGKAGETYNVGSERETTVAQLASSIADAGAVLRSVSIAQRPDVQTSVPRYVPSTAKARQELGLAEYTSLADAIRKTIDWFRSAAHAKV